LSFHDPKATLEAMAAECARSLSDDETYFEYHDLIFTNTPANGTGLSNEVLAGYATQLGLSADKFNTCLNEEQFKDEIAKDLQDGSEAGISGTPACVIGTLDKDGKVTGKLIAGAYPFDSFAAILDEYLK
jgi:protein-disulfide isomerase